MKWITHQAVAVCTAFVLGMPVAGLAGVWAGAVLPDVLDQKRAALSRNRQRAFNRIHRGTTHWFGWWLALWLAGLTGVLPELASAVMAGVGFGAFMHVMLDACTTAGVPVVPWSRQGKFSLGLCRTGSLGEYVFLAVAACVFWLVERQELGRLAAQARQFLPL